MSGKYILDAEHNPIPCDDTLTWGRWFEKADRKVGREKRGDILVSTVFLGIDRNFGYGPPTLFETMIFGGEHDQYQDRCETWNAALQMHKRACDIAFGDT